MSRTRVAELAEAGAVTARWRRRRQVRPPHAGLMAGGDAPGVSRPAAVDPEPIPGMRVLLDDEDVVVVDKPVGVAAHPSPGWTGPTVIGGLAAAGFRVATSGAAERQGIVHRLDVGTSGVMAVAKSEQAYSVLKRAFKERTVDKVYHAVVQGHPDPSRGTVDAPIGRHPVHDYRWAVVSDGKPSVTHYETLEALRAASLLEVHLETGRTHQIRVHMSAVGHPCVGDLTYGADPALAAEARAHPAVAARRPAGLPPPEDGRLDRGDQRLPRRPRPRVGGAAAMSVSVRRVRLGTAEGEADMAAAYAIREEVFVGEQGVTLDGGARRPRHRADHDPRARDRRRRHTGRDRAGCCPTRRTPASCTWGGWRCAAPAVASASDARSWTRSRRIALAEHAARRGRRHPGPGRAVGAGDRDPLLRRAGVRDRARALSRCTDLAPGRRRIL